MRIAVAMMGARRHYAIPRMLNEAGLLAHFYTDIVGIQGFPRYLKYLPGIFQTRAVRRLIGRQPQGIPLSRLSSYPVFGLINALRLSRARTLDDDVIVFLWGAKKFAELIIKEGLGDIDTIYTFDRCGLDLMRYAKKHNIRIIMEQTVAPFKIDQMLLNEERSAFPGWEPVDTLGLDSLNNFSSVEIEEWNYADLILCGSDYVKNAIGESGGPTHKCKVVPFGIDSRFAGISKSSHSGPLRVLTVGTVCLRKGAPYVMQAASLLENIAEFRMVGPIDILPEPAQQLSEYVNLVGQVPRSEIIKHYEWADIFLLPSLNEGSAGVVYEALSCGLPVICTPNTGSVIRDGIDGFIIPIRDVNSIVSSVRKLVTDPNLLSTMSRNARHLSFDYTLSHYKTRLINAISI